MDISYPQTARLLDHESSLAMTTDSSGNLTGSNVLSPYGQMIASNTVEAWGFSPTNSATGLRRAFRPRRLQRFYSDAYSYAGLYKDTESGGWPRSGCPMSRF